MLFLRFLFFAISATFVAVAAGLVIYDVFLAFELGRLLRSGERPPGKGEEGHSSETPVSAAPPAAALGAIQAPLRIAGTRRTIRWAPAAKLVVAAALTALAGLSILVVPDGEAAVRISQISGVRPGTLYAGTHFILPLIDRAQLYDVRDKVFSTSAAEGTREKLEVLNVEKGWKWGWR